MIKKPETVKEYDLRTKLIEEGKLSHEAIEKLLILDKEITRSYAFIESSLPTEIFKPSTFKFEGPGNSDADNYFTSSIDKNLEKISKFRNEMYDI